MARKSAKLTDKEAEAERKKWNVPDWRAKKEYAHIKGLEGDRLRWEFVRRDTRYRAAWENQERYVYGEFGLKAWADPTKKTSPRFTRACSLVDFSKHDTIEQAMHYEALALSTREGGLIFSIDIEHPLKPQLKFIGTIYKKKQEYFIPPTERNGRPNRKNNVKGRKPATLLRVLDACNEGVSIDDMALVFGGREGISEAAMRKTINFAKTFWQRL